MQTLRALQNQSPDQRRPHGNPGTVRSWWLVNRAIRRGLVVEDPDLRKRVVEQGTRRVAASQWRVRRWWILIATGFTVLCAECVLRGGAGGYSIGALSAVVAVGAIVGFAAWPIWAQRAQRAIVLNTSESSDSDTA